MNAQRRGNKQARKWGGFSLLELMIVVAVAAIIMIPIVRFLSTILPFFHRTQVRQQLMADARIAMDTIVERLRNGKALTVVLTSPITNPSQCSRVDFVLQAPLPSGATAYAIYQDGNTVYTQEFIPSPPAPNPGGIQPRQRLASNVTSLMFAALDTQDPAFVTVTLQMAAMAAPLNAAGDQAIMSTILLPNVLVHLVESP